MQLQDTKHDYARGLMGNFYSNDPNHTYGNWTQFKESWYGFSSTKPPFDGYDDTYNHLFRFDVNVYEADDEEAEDLIELSLCFLLPRKGIYSRIHVENITEDDWKEIKVWLKGRKDYQDKLWEGI